MIILTRVADPMCFIFSLDIVDDMAHREDLFVKAWIFSRTFYRPL